MLVKNKNTGKRNLHRHPQGFTLIELLLVMVILAILASVVAMKVVGKTQEARITAARTDISTLKTALGQFEIDNGRFPTTDEGLQALLTNPGLDNWKHAYIDKMPVDPWGTNYVYQCPGTNGQDFDLFSDGPDKQPGTADDVN